MKVTGSHTVRAPRERVWEALQDPNVLVRTLPGCLTLERTGADEYRMTVEAGVASIKGVYAGTVALAEQRAPEAYTLRARGQGAPGTVDATARVTLSDDGDGTVVTYECDAAVGGTVGGVGQRMLQGVARRMAGDFFQAVEAHLAGPAPVPAPATEPAAVGAPAPATPAGSVAGAGEAPTADQAAATAGARQARPAPGAVGEVFHAPPRPARGVPTPLWLLAAAALGAAIALVGVAVGRAG